MDQMQGGKHAQRERERKRERNQEERIPKRLAFIAKLRQHRD